jgi:DNA helicase HerA-like ATPase
MSILVGKTPEGQPVELLPGMANRHGLIAGATGTGKTVTLQTLAEGFSRQGVPVFLADVKGDLAGLGRPGGADPRVQERVQELGLSWSPEANPVLLWDLYAREGHPVRTTISEMGPLLLARLLGLNDNQAGVLHLTFQVADDQGLLLLDLKDLRAMLAWVAEHASRLRTTYGHVTAASVGAIQRRLLELGQAGGEGFFGEPALQLPHLLQRDFSGRGVVSLLHAVRLVQDPRLYGTFLLWLLSELFEELEEVGDRDRPRLVLFFDEAHLLFEDAPQALVDKVEQVVRLIRSRGVGLYFVTQSPADLPEKVLGQLGNRFQHALRAFTPSEQKAVRSAAQSFRPNPGLEVERVLTELGVGEALVSTLDARGVPGVVQRVRVAPPRSRLGPLTPAERAEILQRSPLAGVYDQPVDRESAYERLKERHQEERAENQEARPRGRQRESLGEAALKSLARSLASNLGSQIVRGVLGGIFGRRR